MPCPEPQHTMGAVTTATSEASGRLKTEMGTKKRKYLKSVINKYNKK